MAEWLTRNLETVLFATAVVLLIALASWWFVFLQRAVGTEQQLLTQNLALSATVVSSRLASAESLQAGPVAGEPRFEICTTTELPERPRGGAPVTTYFDGDIVIATHIRGAWWLCTVDNLRDKLRARAGRRSAMLLGEGFLLSALLLVVVVMLYRLVRTERRFREEMEGFLRRVTHEMKTPIAGIKAVLQTIQMGRLPADKLGEIAARALREAEREEHLIQNLLVAQRLRQPGKQLRVDRLDMGALVERLTASRVALASPVSWSVTAPADVLAAADSTAVRTILDNLFDNAAKYGEDRVLVHVRNEEGRVQVDVVDDGVGFDAHQHADLFVPFVRSTDSAAASREGTGLGLSISQQLAEAMRGGIEAHSDGVGRGAKFTLSLPQWTGA